MQPPQFFTARGFEALASLMWFVPQFFCSAYPHMKVGSPGLPAAAFPCALSPQLPVSTPPTGLDESFFNSLVVGLPYSLILGGSSSCFLCLNWLLSFSGLCKEAKRIYLHLHLGQNSLLSVSADIPSDPSAPWFPHSCVLPTQCLCSCFCVFGTITALSSIRALASATNVPSSLILSPGFLHILIFHILGYFTFQVPLFSALIVPDSSLLLSSSE